MDKIKKDTGHFYMGEKMNPEAEITFKENNDGNVVIDHTFVIPNKRGEGIGAKLVQQVVEHAREEDKQVEPICPFAENIMTKNEAYHDVLLEK